MRVTTRASKIALFAVFPLLLSWLPPVAVASAAGSTTTWTRVAGGDRYETASAVSKLAFPSGASTAVVASGEVFPDGLSASYLAGQVGGPVLLTRSSSLPTATLAEVNRLHVSTVFLAGGTGAVSAAVSEQLAALRAPNGKAVTVVRLAGVDRYSTAVAIATRFPKDRLGMVRGEKVALLASGTGFADALSGSAAAAGAHLPLLLTRPDALSPQVLPTLRALGVSRVMVLGGTGAISAGVAAQLTGAGLTITRLGGADRVATATLIASWEISTLGFAGDQVAVARGDDGGKGVDALSAGAFIGHGKHPLLLTASPSTLGGALWSWLQADTALIGGVVVGGPAAISDSLVRELSGIVQVPVGSPTPPDTTPPDTTPPAVPGPVVGTPDNGRVDLSWSEAENQSVAGYVVRQASSAAGPWTAISPDPTTGTTYTVHGLTNGNTYYFTVAAVDGAGNESLPSAATGVVPVALPATSATLAPDSVALAAGDILDATEDGTGRTTVRIAAGPELPPLQGHLVLAPSAAMPNGMFATLIAVQTSTDGTRTVLLEQAALDEVFSTIDANWDTDVTPQPVDVSLGAAPSVSSARQFKAMTSGGVTTLSVASSVFDCKSSAGLPLTPAQAWTSGNPFPVTFELQNLHSVQNFDRGSVLLSRGPSLLMQLSGEVTTTVGLNAKLAGFSCELSTNWRRSHRLFHAVIARVYGVPVTVDFEWALKFSVSAEGTIALSEKRYFGYHYDKQDGQAAQFRRTGSADPVQLNVSGQITAGVFAGGDISVEFGGGVGSANAKAGLYGVFGPDLNLKTSTTDLGCVDLNLDLKGEFGLRLELWVKRWSVELGDASWHLGTIAHKCLASNPTLAISPGAPPQATVGQPYSWTSSATGGTEPLTWSVASGSLPPGLSLSATGDISGTPSAIGSINFTLAVHDSTGASARAELTLTVSSDGSPPTTSPTPTYAPPIDDPSSGQLRVSCPTTSFCMVVDAVGRFVTGVSGEWSNPVPVAPNSKDPLDSVSCSSPTNCIAVSHLGAAYAFDGINWSAARTTSLSNLYAETRITVSCPVTNFCAAVDYNGDAATWDGSAWTPSSQPIGIAGFSSVSCASATWCVAVGGWGNAMDWNGASWQPVTIDDPPLFVGNPSVFESVSCPSASFCMLVDDNGRVLTWNGVAWSPPVAVLDPSNMSAGPGVLSCADSLHCMFTMGGGLMIWDGSTWRASGWMGKLGALLTDVSCPAVDYCVAVDNSGTALTYRGTGGFFGWDAPIGIDTQGIVVGVSCVTADFCVALDQSGFTQTWTGAAWGGPVRSEPGFAKINGSSGPAWARAAVSISCTSPSFCMVVDREGASAVWNGSTWTMNRTSSPHTAAWNVSVSCVSSDFCLAVGGDRDAVVAEIWDGAAWSASVSPDLVPTSVSCPDTQHCVAVGEGKAQTFDGIAWSSPTQIVTNVQNSALTISCATATSCMAVDYNSTDVSTFDGSTWTSTTLGYTSQTGGLVGISCAKTNLCVAMHYNGDTEFWNGQQWFYYPGSGLSPRTTYANLVACTTDGFCALALNPNVGKWG